MTANRDPHPSSNRRTTASVVRSVAMALLMGLATPTAIAGAQEAERRTGPGGGGVDAPSDVAVGKHLSPDGTLGDLLAHPAFAGFAPLLLPWDGRAYDPTMRLRDIAMLLPYHSHADPEVVVRSLDRMIDDAARGKRIYYDVYGEAEKRRQPDKANAGLFFLRGKPGAPFAVIAPGGGFAYVGSLHEGFPYAVDINRLGYNAFVVKYRAGLGGGAATEDMAAAISFILRNADALGVAKGGYSVWGSSAGARMAAAIGSHGVAAFGGDTVAKPSAVIMAYTAHSDVSRDEPPTFVIVGEQDGIAPPSAMERRISALRRLGTPVEYRRIPGIGHGFGTGVGTSAEGWITEATRFWQRFIPPEKTDGR